MIPNTERFGDVESISGSIDDILTKSQDINVDYVYGDKQAIHEIMVEFNCSEEQASKLFEEAKMQMIQNCLDELIKEGKVVESGFNSDGEVLYKHAGKKKRKKTI